MDPPNAYAAEPSPGLAIVRDLVEFYGGIVALSASPLGGLRVELWLPT